MEVKTTISRITAAGEALGARTYQSRLLPPNYAGLQEASLATG